MDDETTVSWLAIEPHWRVYSADDEHIGEVFLVVGAPQADIFDGLAITHHGGPRVMHHYTDKPRYVGFEQVAAIEPERVVLTITSEQSEHLPAYEAGATQAAVPGRDRWSGDGGDVEHPPRSGAEPGAGEDQADDGEGGRPRSG